MAGLGVRLNRIYEKHSLITTLGGISYSIVVTIAPMVLVIGTVFALQQLLGFNKLGYAERELFSCTMLYMFIFSLLITSPLNAVISRYIADVIYEEKYDEIMPCFYFALGVTIVAAMIPAVPFFIHEFVVGKVDILYIMISFVGYLALIYVFYVMQYLSATKDYAKMSAFYFFGMMLCFITAVVLNKLFGVSCTVAMLVGLDVGFLLIAGFEMAQVRHYFTTNSHNYTGLLPYFGKYWWLIVSNSFYMLGLYIHNFVFWTTDMRIVVRDSFVCAEPYDMATFLALATNISATVIFITSVERKFHEKYRGYSEAVIGGRLSDIEIAKKRMFDQLSMQLLELTRLQFIISVVIFLVMVVVLPQVGLSGLVMQIYPLLGAGYYVMFLMYGAMIFLYYFNDLFGAMLTGIVFFSVSFAGAWISKDFHPIWYGAGLLAGALAAWTVAYFRLRWVERNMDRHIFCVGHIIAHGKGTRPPDLVWSREMGPPPLVKKDDKKEEKVDKNKEDAVKHIWDKNLVVIGVNGNTSRKELLEDKEEADDTLQTDTDSGGNSDNSG